MTDQTRTVRSGVEDRWFKKVKQPDGSTAEVPSKNHGIKARWRARYVDAEGQEREKVFSVKKEAEAFLREKMSAVHTGSHLDPVAGKVTVRQQHQIWVDGQGHIAAKTAQTRTTSWVCHVEPRWARVAVADIRTTAIRSWIGTMVKNGVGVPTIENSYHVLRGILASAVEDRCILVNPCDGVKLPRREHHDRGYLTHAQVRALSAAVTRDPIVVLFLAYTGLRWGEMAALRIRDFDMLRRRVSISRSVTEVGGLDWKPPKTWERRSVPFPAALSKPLAALMEGKKLDDLVFTNQRGDVLRNSNWRARVFAPAVEKCQSEDDTFPAITPHDLRHTAASLAISAGANVKAVQRMLGHKDASMTLNVYSDLFDSDLDEVAANLDKAIVAAQETADPETPAGSLRDLDSDTA